ncbi:uncharacterized protein LOC114521625 isoform X2 [Dendronephthya gigantea]|uniref:uncharacterized protein LOC114521625 isoform X2 n=1 Tax=Dendronephthya gigantea TaxID=151771 RepID=UPI00106DC96F|nr:uncharacterized protein LOC114521625 isoform X2 [Dendronephthya gigantea]
MATETERKRFHLEQIIEHISEETTLEHSVSSGLTLVTSGGDREDLDNVPPEKRDFGEDSDGIKSVESESTSEEESGNDKDSSADDIVVPVKISPRCDVCGLLHFKSYRCVTRFSAPLYIREAFDDNYQKIRVCRKCLTSKENCVENVAISNLARYSDKIRQMKIPLGMTSDRRTKPFEFVVRDLRQLKNNEKHSSDDTSWLNLQASSPPHDSLPETPRKTLLQRFQVDDPVQKNLFLRELNLYSTDFLNNVARNNENGVPQQSDGTENQQSNGEDMDITQSEDREKSLYHVAAKNVLGTNVPERKIGESFGARKGLSHDLVMNTKRAWKPNKKYDDLRKVGNPSLKKGIKQRVQKSAVKKENAGEKTGDSPDKIRTCGINCAVCGNHVQKSYSCCTLQTAPEKFKHLFVPGVVRLKICRKCIPYKKVIKLDEPVVVKKKVKVKQKRGRKPTKILKPTTVVKAIPRDATLVTTAKDDVKVRVKNEPRIDDHKPFTSILNPEHATVYHGTYPSQNIIQVVNGEESMNR